MRSESRLLETAVRHRPGRECVQVLLEDEGGGRGVELALADAPVFLQDGQPALRLATGQPLILEHHNAGDTALERPGKRLDPSGHRRRRTIEPPRQADDDGLEPLIYGESVDDLQHHSDRLFETGSPNHLRGSRQCAAGIADRHADAALPYVQRDNTSHDSMILALPPAPASVSVLPRTRNRRVWLGVGLSLALLCAGVPHAVAAQEASTSRLDARIRALELEATSLATSARTLVNELRALEVERNLRTAEAAHAEAELDDATRALDETSTRVEQLEQQRDAQLPAIRRQLVELHKHGRTQAASMVFAAGDVRQLGRAVRAATALVDMNRRRLDAHQETLAHLHAERAALERQQAELRLRDDTARRARRAADRAVRAHAARLREIDARRDLTAQYAGELQVARDALIEQLGAGGDGADVRVPLLPFKGALEWPAEGKLVGRFGQSVNRLGGTAVRNGVELGAPLDTAVHAIHDGTVVHAGPFTGFGLLVIIDHGRNHFSLYGYLADVLVQSGDRVQSGYAVGRVGTAPAGPPALYFELRIDGRAVDPVQWLEPR
jgi:murein hydrolase activator